MTTMAEPSRLALYICPADWAVPAMTCTFTKAGSPVTLLYPSAMEITTPSWRPMMSCMG